MTARLWLPLLLAAGLAGCRFGASSPPSPSGKTSGAPGQRADVRFTSVAGAMGLDFRWKTVKKAPLNILEIMSAGAGFIDYDQDGWPDIVLVGPEGCAIYHNEHGARFRNVTAELGLDQLKGRWHGVAVADVDNDGWPDLFLTGYQHVALLRNQGGKKFTDVTAGSGLEDKGWSTSASFFDADRDGRVDLLVGQYVDFGPGSPEFMTRSGVQLTMGPDVYPARKLRFFHNLGGFHFRDDTQAAGFGTTSGKTLGIAACDIDNNGADDVYVANDEMPGNLFVNDGHGHFVDKGTESGTALSGTGRRQGGMGVTWGDYNHDLRPDLLVTTFTQEPKDLYRNDGGGLFTEVSYQAQLSQGILPWVGFGVAFVDVNRDGWPDIAMVNGHVEDLVHQVDSTNDYPQPMKLFLNNRDGTFTDATSTTGDGFQRSIVGRALAVGDFNNDGAPDLLAADLEGSPVLLRNDSPAGAHWLGLNLVGGAKSNRMAIGARVVLTAGSGPQLRDVRTDGSYLAAHDPRLLFGLGTDTQAQKVEVRWPSGAKQTVSGLQADRYYRWEEGKQPVEIR